LPINRHATVIKKPAGQQEKAVTIFTLFIYRFRNHGPTSISAERGPQKFFFVYPWNFWGKGQHFSHNGVFSKKGNPWRKYEME